MNKRNELTLKLALAAACLACFAGSLAGQNLTPDDITGSSALDPQTWSAGQTNAVFLTQVGSLNETQVQQSGNAAAATPNLARIYQDGDRQFAQAVQIGQNNRTDILQQGQANTVLSTVEGIDIQTLIVQTGEGNSVVQNISNSLNVTSKFVQNGDNNRIEQEVVGQNGRTFQLTQNGNDLKAIIRVVNQ